jgi:arylsulfatase A-like enzyme
VVSGPCRRHHQVEPPKTPEQGYHLTEDLADKAIEFIADAKQVALTRKPSWRCCRPA